MPYVHPRLDCGGLSQLFFKPVKNRNVLPYIVLFFSDEKDRYQINTNVNESVPNSHTCEESLLNPHTCENLKNWLQILTHVKNRYQIIKDVKIWFLIFTDVYRT